MKIEHASDLKKYKPRFHLAQPPNKGQEILRETFEQWKRPLIGNNDLMDDLENRIDRFLEGDVGVEKHVSGKAPIRSILIHGPPQSGKSTLAGYLAGYAAIQSQNGTNADLSLVRVELVSSYKGGDIKKLVSQTNEVKKNTERKYLIVQDNLNSTFDQSDPRLVTEFCRFMDDKSLDNYLLLGVTDGDTHDDIQPRVRDRFQTYFWEGAASPEQKADLILINTCLSNAFDIKDGDYCELGQLAHELKLSGGEISAICYHAARSTVNPDAIRDNVSLTKHQVNSDTFKEMMKNYGKSTAITYGKSKTP